MASIKRRKCKQLTKFVTLVDFLLLDAFSEVVKRSLDLFHAFVLRGANAATITRLTDHDDLTLAMHQTVNVARQSEATLVIKRLDLLPMAIINQIQALMTTGEVPGILSLEEQVHLATRVCDERLLALKSQHAAQVAQIRAEAEASRDQALAILHQKQRDAPTTPMLEAFQQVETRDDLRRQREVESESVAATVMALTRPLGVTSGKWASAVARMCSKLRIVLLVDKEHEQQVRTASPSIFSTCDVVSVPPLDRESLRTLVLWGVACMATDMHLAVINALKDEYLPTSRIFAMAEFFDRDLGALRSSDKLLTEQLSTIDQQLVNDEEKLVEQKQDAERIRVIMQRFRTAADEQILVTTEAQEQAQKELREPMNCLEEANRALLLVDRRHIVEIKSFVSPPPLVQLVLGAVCVLFQLESSWESARRLLLGDANFVQNLLQFNKDAVSAATLSKLETEYLSDERFRREEVERQSVAAASMVGWVRAIHQYATSRQKVQPTLDKLEKAQGRLQLIMQEFQVSKDRVVEADGTWQTTQAAIDTATTKKEALKDEIASLGARCDSGDRAMEALKEDRKLQNEAASAISMRRGFSLTTWNALLSAGALAGFCSKALGLLSGECKGDLGGASWWWGGDKGVGLAAGLTAGLTAGCSVPVDSGLVSMVDEYLSSASVSDDEPALALHWEQNALSQFVDAANSVDDGVDMPEWLSHPRGSITPDSIVEDMMAFLATKAGGRFGRVLLAPNSVVQFGQLCGMFAYIENDVFVRAAAAGMSDGATLAKVFCLTKGSASAAVPMEFPPRENQSRRLFS
ncbi:hypothetical protein JG688_00004799 [Phytophthora aleatoria]|uniref:Dynein heavy chain coiled coil stalk domain-containing protein n=1 Tax=Phytophthora aleatoria TaxID=2496075 RepID=A0A8J5J0E8_9STRA|nr:hypothetical protein JG688_00004799 [Phytophthora aleatoria]